MADRFRVAIVGLLLASTCACSSARPSRGTEHPRSARWSAVGVPAREAPETSSDATSGAGSSAPVGVPSMSPWQAGQLRPAPKAMPEPQSVDQHSADAMALGGAQALASADTFIDHQPQDTAVRAARAGWLTPAYGRAQLTASLTAPPGTEWDTWTRHQAYVVVTAKLGGDDHPPDTATVAARMVLLTEQAIGRDGWRDNRTTSVVAVVLKQVNHVWRIDSDQPS